MNIREFTPDDYQALATLHNAIYPDQPITPEDPLEQDRNRDPKCRLQRWVAEQGGQVIGIAHYSQSPWLYHPQKFTIIVRVHPDHWRRGIGSRLYDTVWDALAPFDPIELDTEMREDHDQVLRWLEQRGYVEYRREQQSVLDIAACDLTPLADLETQLAARGITLASYPELTDDPNRDQKLYDLDMTVSRDIPGMDEFTPPGLDQWRKEIVERARPVMGAMTIAQHGDLYIGFSNVFPNRAKTSALHTDITGVRREYRRLGVATALKMRVIQWAKANGKTEIRTANAETNPMLQLNYRLGFRPAPAWIRFRKTIRAEDQA